VQRDAFRDWATGGGGLSEAAARSHLKNLTEVETVLATDLDTDWTRTRLRTTREQLDRTDRLNDRTKADYRQSLETYDTFRSHTSA
jgi:shikimate kinase